MRKIRVLIVEDSQVIRQLLEFIIARHPRLEIVGAVESGEEALRILADVRPDVISMDIRLPGMNGLEATQRIMRERPTPVVVVASADSEVSMRALEAGALTVLEKPVGVTSEEFEPLAERICTQLTIMSEVKVIRRHLTERPSGALRRRAAAPIAGAMLGIVSSTGGPTALAQLLSRLGPNFPLPILLVQHITSHFLGAFAAWLESVSPFPVEIVRDRAFAMPGRVYLAAEDHHLRAGNGFLRVDRGDPISQQRPSGTVLFDSMAASLGSRAIGVLLTGMGEDGAEGLLRLRQSGGYTIAEDESTAVVYGMPAVAVRLGGVSESLPLPAIAPRILELA